MSDQPVPIGTTQALLTEDEARVLVTRIRKGLNHLRSLILELHDGQGWKALGYDSWQACCDAEFIQSRSYIDRQLRAARVEVLIVPIGTGEDPLPEGALRPLTTVPKEDVGTVWETTVETYGERPTGSQVQHVIDELYDDETQTDPSSHTQSSPHEAPDGPDIDPESPPVGAEQPRAGTGHSGGKQGNGGFVESHSEDTCGGGQTRVKGKANGNLKTVLTRGQGRRTPTRDEPKAPPRKTRYALALDVLNRTIDSISLSKEIDSKEEYIVPLSEAAEVFRAYAPDSFSVEIPDWLDPDLWDYWMVLRNKRDKGLTAKGAALQIEKLETFRRAGHDPNEVLKTTLREGWAATYEPKKDDVQNSRGTRPGGPASSGGTTSVIARDYGGESFFE